MDFKLIFTLLFIVALQGCNSKNEKPAMEKMSNGSYVLAEGNLRVGIDPELGGRIFSVQIDGKELLLQSRPGLLNWGSTLWPAPQSRWNWPPPAAIQLGKYASKIQGDKLILESPTDTTFGFRAIKTFSFDKEKSGLTIEYTFINDADSAQHVGPWEISCVPAEGIVFFPLGAEPANSSGNLAIEQVGGIALLRYDPNIPAPPQKLYNNATEGWLAHVNEDQVLFVKSFAKIPAEDLAPGQGNVEVYVNKELSYIELENHGAYRLLQPGQSLKYQVTWYVRQLKAEEAIFNQDLVALVRDLVK